MSKNQSLKNNGPSQDHHFGCSENLAQNILHEIDKPNKTRQKKKSLISTFPCFLTAIAKV